jgi:2-polyprenyl-6-methoxyphenol hydroxylase-like FAD-dependent oxidoreductase
MSKEPILIVGAGPTGLVMALWLTKAGVPVRIIDKASGPGTTSRALVFHARNLEFYRQLGIDQVALERGIQTNSGNLWVRGQAVAKLPFGDFGRGLSRYPYALIFPQDLHEEMLVELLEALNVYVERETELLDLALLENGLKITLRKSTGEKETYEVGYLAGCDGARSTVREKLGVQFPGGTYSDVYYVADVKGTGPVVNGEVNIALDDADFLAVFPMKGEGRIRLVGAVHQDVKDTKDLVWEDVSPRIIQRLGLNVNEMKWFSSYRVHHRVVFTFQKRRAFLLGDAAHIHSPVGGQGMNTGIGDAVNLAWKLAAVWKGDSPPQLLETYEPERIAFARRLVATTDRVFAFVSARGPFATWLRLNVVPRLFPALFQFAAVRRTMFRIVSQVAIQYPQSALSQGPEGTSKGGERLPWVQFVDAQGFHRDNFACLSSMNWQVHCYGTPSPGLKTVCEVSGVEMHVFPWQAEMEKAGLKRSAAYVIRPDGHIGIVDGQNDTHQVSSYLRTWRPAGRPSESLPSSDRSLSI